MPYTPTVWENGKTRLNASNMTHLGAQYDAAVADLSPVVSAAAFPTFRKALASVRAGVRDAKVLCIGDSTTAGVGADPANVFNHGGPGSYPYQLARLLGAYVPAASGLGIPPSKISGSPDVRWTPGSGWATGNFAWGNGSAYVTTQGATAALTFTGGVLADTYDIYYLQNAGLGSITVQATGGNATTTNTVGAAAVKKVTVSAGAASATNVVTITPAGNLAPVLIIGVESSLSTTRKVRVGNAGVGSSTSAQWVALPNDFGGIPAIKAYAPDLTIISLGINDTNGGVAPADFGTALRAIIAAAKVSGDVLVLPPLPFTAAGPAASIALEKQYAATAAALGPMLDLYSRTGLPGTDTAKDLGMMADSVHPNAVGYADLAQFLATKLAAV